MSDTALFLSLAVVIGAFVGIGIFILVMREKQKNKVGQYNWQPDQDYDVVLKGESAMTPGFATLVKRKTDKSEANKNQIE